MVYGQSQTSDQHALKLQHQPIAHQEFVPPHWSDPVHSLQLKMVSAAAAAAAEEEF
jgi:hypothetical protein